MRRSRAGFGLLMVVVFIGIIATILAISMQAIMVGARVSRVTETWKILESVRRATYDATAPASYPVFRQRVGSNPGRLSQLLSPVDNNDATNFPDACGFSFNNSQRRDSEDWEPFLTRTFDPATGLSTPMGLIANDFVRVQISGVTYLMAVIAEADLLEIELMDELFDGADGAAAGAVRWDNISGSTARFTYMITIDNAC